MSSGNALTGVIRQIRSETGGESTDAELLDRYTRCGDEDAFAAVVRRYGGLVLGVARRQLADSQQAEDVFQATFLALARTAARLGGRPTLTNWLYTVALRQARKARGRDARRETLERSASQRTETNGDPLDDITGRELLQIVDEELMRLPDRYRLPVLLCCVRGLSREEAAAHLGWSDGAVKGRLERGRRRLAARLAARGLAPSAVLFAPLATIAVPNDLLARTVAMTRAPWSQTVPPFVATLAAISSSRRVLPAVLALGTLAVGLAAWAIAIGGTNPMVPAPQPPAAVAGSNTAPDDEPLPEGSILRFGTTRFRQGPTILNLTISADGKIALAGCGSRRFGTIRTYDMTTGRVLLTLADQHEYVAATTLSPDGKVLAVKRGDHAVHLYDAATGRATTKIPYPTANPSSMSEWLTFSPDGTRILVGTATGDGVHLVDIGKLDVVRTFKHDKIVFAAAFSPDGKLVAAGGYDHDKNVYFARLWEADTGKELRHFKFGNGGIRCLTFSPDGKTLAIGGDGGNPLSVKLFEVATAKELTKIVFPDASSVRSVAFSPDGKTVAASGGSSTRLFDAATGKENLKIDLKAINLHFAPDGASLVGAVSGTIYRWDAKTGKVLTPESADGVIGQIEVSADGKRIVTRGQDGDAHVWDTGTGEHLHRVEVTWQRGMALSPDAKYLVWPVADETIKYKNPGQPNAIYTGSRLKMLDLTNGKLVERFGGFEGDAHDLFFTADGKTLVTVDHTNGSVRFWDFATGKVKQTFTAARENDHIWHTRLSPDGKVLAATYQPTGRGIFSPFAVRLWDTTTGKELHDLVGHQTYVEAIAFSPDGKYLITGGDALGDFAQKQLKLPADQVFVWDVETGKSVARLPMGGTAGAFSADGKTLSVATESGTIQVWDVATWKLKGEFRGHRDRVTALASAAEGRLFSGSVDTTVLAWDIRAAKPPAERK